jgi:polysaccharide deacetylase family protein (PEP-CTERM system associated)
MIPVGQSPVSSANSELRSEPERPGISERHGARGGPKSSGMCSADACSADSDPINAMSVDVEDYFQVSAFERHIHRDTWDSIPRRVEANVDRILQLFDDFGVKATFFTLGWIAERHPTMVKRIVGAGHELASHGYSHVRVTELDPAAFRRDVTTTKGLLEDLAGVAVRGYRAPSYSIGASNLWALRILEETGHAYSSSIYPIRHDLYGMPSADRFRFVPADCERLVEVPVTTVAFGKRKVPCGGGGYFRLFPYAYSRWAVRRVNRVDGESAVFYFHPWEIDPEQPVQRGIGVKTRFRHYLNLQRMEARLRRLAADFRWGRMDEVFLTADLPTSVAHRDSARAG